MDFINSPKIRCFEKVPNKSEKDHPSVSPTTPFINIKCEQPKFIF